MPTWQKIERPLYGIVGLTVISWVASGRSSLPVEIVIPTYGTALLLCGITGGRYADAALKRVRRDIAAEESRQHETNTDGS